MFHLMNNNNKLVMLSSLLAEYDFNQHVASDIVIDEHYVLSSSLKI